MLEDADIFIESRNVPQILPIVEVEMGLFATLKFFLASNMAILYFHQ